MHPCSINGHYRCEGKRCGDGNDRYNGVCDKDGCDFNPYRLGAQDFYGQGSGFTVDSSKPITVVTQFITSDGTDSGDLIEVRRMWVQNGIVQENSLANLTHLENYNSIKDSTCAIQKQEFNEMNDFSSKGGLSSLGKSLDRGMVLVLSVLG
jgi:cellulose 1,4-beta-cellobiosidase